MSVISVVAAVIKHDDKYLCAQRKRSKFEYLSYKFEFPGGKVESNETHEQALHRGEFPKNCVTAYNPLTGE